MALSAKGLVEASDYNTQNNRLTNLWGVGNGVYGLGQTTLSNVSGGSSLVTAAQWTSLFQRVNLLRQHYNNPYTPFTSTYPTAGDLLQANTTVSNAIDTLVSNYALPRGQSGSGRSASATTYIGNNGTYTGSRYWIMTSANASNMPAKGFRFTFSSLDQARYFFNAGGYIELYYNGAYGFASNSASPNRGYAANYSNAWNALTLNANAAVNAGSIYSGTQVAMTGVTTYTFNFYEGYGGYGANVVLANAYPISYSTAYSTGTTYSTISANIGGGGRPGTNNSGGTNITIWYNSSCGLGSYTDTNDNVTMYDYGYYTIYYPAITYISNTWGAVTTTQL